MNWYYVHQGQQAGPVNDEQLDLLVKNGQVTPETLVWRQGLANWVALRDSGRESSLATSRLDSGSGPASAPAPEAVCVECGKIFPLDDTIAFGNVRVCSGCKPVYLQKMAEGVPVHTGELQYARILARFAAVFLDGIILGAVNLSLGLVVGLLSSQAARSQHGAVTALQLGLMAVQIGIALSYETFMIGKYGATIGKMACKVKVVTADGGQVSYPRALGRYFAKMLSGFTCLIGYVIALFDDQKRALHDHICNTRVVVK